LRRERILVAGMPRMLCDIITGVIATESDMEIVGRLPDRLALLSATTDLGADVVVLGIEDAALPDDCAALFDARPSVRVLGVATDDGSAFLWELRPQRVSLGEVSPQGLVEAIRKQRPRGVPGARQGE